MSFPLIITTNHDNFVYAVININDDYAKEYRDINGTSLEWFEFWLMEFSYSIGLH